MDYELTDILFDLRERHGRYFIIGGIIVTADKMKARACLRPEAVGQIELLERGRMFRWEERVCMKQSARNASRISIYRITFRGLVQQEIVAFAGRRTRGWRTLRGSSIS